MRNIKQNNATHPHPIQNKYKADGQTKRWKDGGTEGGSDGYSDEQMDRQILACKKVDQLDEQTEGLTDKPM